MRRLCCGLVCTFAGLSIRAIPCRHGTAIEGRGSGAEAHAIGLEPLRPDGVYLFLG